MPRPRRGITLIEVLVVVVILAIVATIVFPETSTATEEARLTALEANLNQVRKQIALYRLQHRDALPADFIAQMTGHTDRDGDVAETRSVDFPFGPYLERIPPNPVTGIDTIRLDASPAGFLHPEVDAGWYFNTTTGEFRADLTEETEQRFYD